VGTFEQCHTSQKLLDPWTIGIGLVLITTNISYGKIQQPQQDNVGSAGFQMQCSDGQQWWITSVASKFILGCSLKVSHSACPSRVTAILLFQRTTVRAGSFPSNALCFSEDGN